MVITGNITEKWYYIDSSYHVNGIYNGNNAGIEFYLVTIRYKDGN